MHCLALSRQIGHYHNARFREAATHFDRFTVLSCAGEGFFSEFAANSFDGYEVETIAAGRQAYAAEVVSGVLSKKVAAALDRHAPDAVAAPGWASTESFAALSWARTNHVPIVVMAESQADDAARSWAREALKAHIVRQFDAAFAGGYSTRDYLVDLGMDEARITLGYNAVDNDHFSREAATARAEPQTFRTEQKLPDSYFLASGRFIEKKNFPLLVRAYARARAVVGTELPDLVILGDGEGLASIQAQIVLADLERHVHLPGYKEYNVLPGIYALSHGFIHVAKREQWGLVINEAMAAGVPVIVSDRCGATRTLLDGTRGGYVIDPTDESAIAAAIETLSRMSREDWSAMADDAAAAVANWGPERFGSGLAEAVSIAAEYPQRGSLALWDQILIDRLARKLNTDVD